jgi:hypothetical protein
MPQSATIKSLPAAFGMMRPCRPTASNGARALSRTGVIKPGNDVNPANASVR